MAQDYTAIRVTDDAKAVAEESKRDGETWNDFIQRCAKNPPEVREYVAAESVPDGLEAIANGDVDTDEIERSLETIEQRTGRIERTLEELQG